MSQAKIFVNQELGEVNSLSKELQNQKMVSQGVLRLEKEKAYHDYEKLRKS